MNQIIEATSKINEAKDKLENLSSSPEPQSTFEHNQNLIEDSKKQLHSIIQSYFTDLEINYLRLKCRYPNKEIQQNLTKSIDEVLQELSYYQKKLKDQSLTDKDFENFEKAKFLQRCQDLELSSNLFCQPAQFQQHNDDQKPILKFSNIPLEQLQSGLNQHCSVMWYNQKDEDELQIRRLNYFDSTTKHVSFFSKNTIQTYDIEQQKKFSSELTEYISEEGSIVILPNGDIFISGGLDHNGFIQGSCYIVKVTDLSIQKKQDMTTKRVGHTLLYVPPSNAVPEGQQGYIYCIGGRTHNNFRSKLCERYNIHTQVWESIDKLHYARSRAACALAREQDSIYTFFGTDSIQKNIIFCERFDILSGIWAQFNIENGLTGIDFTWGNAIQINEDQILLYGGFRDSDKFQDSLTQNRKLILFNIESESLVILNKQLPIDILPIYSVVQNNSIYVIGKYITCLQPPPHQSISDGAFVIEINQNIQVLSHLG